jgi:hypothetical protein
VVKVNALVTLGKPTTTCLLILIRFCSKLIEVATSDGHAGEFYRRVGSNSLTEKRRH